LIRVHLLIIPDLFVHATIIHVQIHFLHEPPCPFVEPGHFSFAKGASARSVFDVDERRARASRELDETSHHV
jgi:hypothetical protein